MEKSHVGMTKNLQRKLDFIMKKLDCETCCKSNNHCCLTDIPYEPPIAMAMIGYGEDAGIKDVLMIEHPKLPERVMLVNQDMSGKDVSTLPCVFFKDNKCAIYENRPDICRLYGTEHIRCRYEASDKVFNLDGYNSLTRDDIEELDSNAMKKNRIVKYVNRMIK